MAYAVFLRPAALRDLRKLSEDIRRRVAARRELAQEKVKGRSSASGGPKRRDRVCFWPDGVAWTKWTVETQFKGVLTAAKIERPLVFHALQCTFASPVKPRGCTG